MAKRELAYSYDGELNSLKNRLSLLEESKDDVLMENNLQELALTTDTEKQLAQQEQRQEPTQSETHQIPNFNNTALELTIKALNGTIDSLTRTIENLALAVEKPVDTLARTVETLATATTKSTMYQRNNQAPVTVQPPVEKPSTPPESVQQIAPVVELNKQSLTEVITQEQPTEAVEESLFDKFKQAHVKVPFNKKLLSLGNEIKNYFSEVHNELISYKKVNYRISFKCISYRVGRKTIAKLAVRGKTLKFYLALNVNDFSRTVYFQEDSSNVKMYEDVPFTVKIKSNRGKKNAINLVSYLAESNNLVKNEQFKKENILKELKSINQ